MDNLKAFSEEQVKWMHTQTKRKWYPGVVKKEMEQTSQLLRNIWKSVLKNLEEMHLYYSTQ